MEVTAGLYGTRNNSTIVSILTNAVSYHIFRQIYHVVAARGSCTRLLTRPQKSVSIFTYLLLYQRGFSIMEITVYSKIMTYLFPVLVVFHVRETTRIPRARIEITRNYWLKVEFSGSIVSRIGLESLSSCWVEVEFSWSDLSWAGFKSLGSCLSSGWTPPAELVPTRYCCYGSIVVWRVLASTLNSALSGRSSLRGWYSVGACAPLVCQAVVAHHTILIPFSLDPSCFLMIHSFFGVMVSTDTSVQGGPAMAVLRLQMLLFTSCLVWRGWYLWVVSWLF